MMDKYKALFPLGRPSQMPSNCDAVMTAACLRVSPRNLAEEENSSAS